MSTILDAANLALTQSLGERAFSVLQQAILRGELSPGARLNDLELARKLGISRSPVREALKRLEYEGLVVFYPRRGAFVVTLSRKQVLDILEVRESLEVLAVRLATPRLSDQDLLELRGIFDIIQAQVSSPEFKEYPHHLVDFHAYLVQASGNECLIKFMQAIRGQSRLLRFQSAASRERVLDALEEHLGILEAITKKDVDLAEKRMQAHLRNAKRNILRMFPEDAEGWAGPAAKAEPGEPSGQDRRSEAARQGARLSKLSTPAPQASAEVRHVKIEPEGV